MTKRINRLTVVGVKSLREGLHADGGGLYLNANGSGRRWVYIWRCGNRRREMGLGSAANVSLAQAREKASAARAIVAAGGDPIAVREAERRIEAAEPVERSTFGAFAEGYIAQVEAGWRNPVHRAQWKQSLRDHASAIYQSPLDEVDTEDVLAVLRPIWLTKPETASRVRGRIEKILDAAKAQGLRPRDSLNPAAWRGHLALLLPKQSKLVRGHHAALPYAEMPDFWTALRTRKALAGRCLEYVILTASRSGEALGATWGEIDFSAKIWVVPAQRMKAGTEHVVPLSPAALSVLESVRPGALDPAAAVFSVGGAARSNMAMSMLLRRMNIHNATVHGFRSTFRDWAGDTTSFPREVVEQALAHTVGNKVERAYRRSTAIERRRELMCAWADFLKGDGTWK